MHGKVARHRPLPEREVRPRPLLLGGPLPALDQEDPARLDLGRGQDGVPGRRRPLRGELPQVRGGDLDLLGRPRLPAPPPVLYRASGPTTASRRRRPVRRALISSSRAGRWKSALARTCTLPRATSPISADPDANSTRSRFSRPPPNALARSAKGAVAALMKTFPMARHTTRPTRKSGSSTLPFTGTSRRMRPSRSRSTARPSFTGRSAPGCRSSLPG
jgi:hypothetical protein